MTTVHTMYRVFRGRRLIGIFDSYRAAQRCVAKHGGRIVEPN